MPTKNSLKYRVTRRTIDTCRSIALLVAVLCVHGTAVGQVIAPTGDWVTDRAGLLSSSQVQSLSATLAGHEQTSSTQIVIVILPDLDGRDASSYAFELGETWGVGQKGADNGIVLLVSVGDRQVFIATGYGVEGSVPDVIAGRIIREIITPRFRQGRYYEGLQNAVAALVEATEGQTPTQLAKSPVGSVDPRRLMFALFVIAVILIIFVVIRRMGSDDDWPDRPGRRRRRRRRGSAWPYIIWGGGFSHTGGGGGGFSGGGGFGGFSGGGGSFGGGGAGGGW